MPTRVTFDNNFLDKFNQAHAEERRRILDCVASGGVEFYANFEMLRELMGLAASPARKRLIIPYSADVLALTGGKILNEVLPMLETELRGTFELQLPKSRLGEIVAFLEQAASGHVPDAALVIGTGAIDEKSQAKAGFDAMFRAFETHFGGLNDSERAKITLEQLQAGWWSKKGRDTVLRFCADWGVPNPEQTADQVMANPERFPHVQA
ncbi:MAG: hypothetical protein U0704_15745 [Candidatus Eisenbacteria bacterium]